MQPNVHFWALALFTSQAIASVVRAPAPTATLLELERNDECDLDGADACHSYISSQLAMPTPGPGLQAVTSCSVRFTEDSKSKEYADYHRSVEQYFSKLDDKISSLSSATSCAKPFTTKYSNICTGNMTYALAEVSTGTNWAASVTNAVIHTPLALPTGDVVIEWAEASTTASGAAAATAGASDKDSEGAVASSARMGLAIGLAVVGTLWVGL